MSESLLDSFGDLTDPRNDKNKRHQLLDVIAIGICAVIGGCEGWDHIEEFAKSKESWFKEFLELPNGIPSYSTIRRVFVLVDSQEFESCFLSWVDSIRESTDLDILSIDGKTLRRSHDRDSGAKAIHMVSAWSKANGMVLGQVKTSEKSNEITAIPQLLKTLYLKGSIVTIDAMGCQVQIADQIVEQEGDYVLALKGNQGSLHNDVVVYLREAMDNSFEGEDFQFYEEVDKGHGRLETRRYWTSGRVDWLVERHLPWDSIRTIAVVERIRETKEKVTREISYYIASIENDAKLLAQAIRSHWGVENPLHWCLDVTFREDESRIRSGNAAENFAVLRHIALNLLKREKTHKKSVKLKRMKAGWDNDYLKKVLFS